MRMHAIRPLSFVLALFLLPSLLFATAIVSPARTSASQLTDTAQQAKPVLRRGSTGTAVRELQRRLNVWIAATPAARLRLLPVTGTFGPATETAVRAFQRNRRLPVTGVVAALTWAALPPDPSVAAPSAPAPTATTAPARPAPTAPAVPAPAQPTATTAPARPAPTATTAPPPPAAAPDTGEPRQLTANLAGSGASFPNPLYQAWIQVYKQVVPGVTISYQSVGSGQGIRDFIGYLTDFGGTDAVIESTRLTTEAPDALHVPTVLGGVVATYNLPGTGALRFSSGTLAGIYLGQITRWNHPAIAADNPGVSLPATDIIVVYRSDSSGTTSIFTDYLTKVSAEWRANVGVGTTVKWPTGVGAPGNAGVAATVKQTTGAIGYVELIYALANNLPAPAVRNAAGNYVTASLSTVTAAASGIDYPDDLRLSITNPPGANAYPIAGFTWILVRANTYTDVNKARALTDFIYWSLTEGQGAANRLGYAPLPQEARQLAMRQLRKVTVRGQQVFSGPIK